ncbi:hypothetical protein ONE63_007992 [Megalurothrips usitatus]|uniref:Uncharacterized protein n=1 Tax=Megalurothrips usitatus TaxID=439358 RepID=A0AAV7XQB6_9NEOP|nr:hypothetical protein ONE63_007992 [Megalurothrips usitatus]
MGVLSELPTVDPGSNKSLKIIPPTSPLSWVCSNVVGYLAPALLPPLHIGLFYYIWHQYSRHVDKRYCTCSCWDTVFKGTYESGIASYKHIYFNATGNTLKIWVLTVAAVILLYECVRQLTFLGLRCRLRLSMTLLFLSSLFSHYYSWWVFVNYWNDDFYSQWNHQLFFTITEVVSTAFVMRLADNRVSLTPFTILSIVGIALIHVLTSGTDQFILNVVRGEGYLHQVMRDLSLMIPDILHISLPLIELKRAQKLRLDKEMRQNVCVLICFVVFGFIVSSLL